MTRHSILTELRADLTRLEALDPLHPATQAAITRLKGAMALLEDETPIPPDDVMAVADAVQGPAYAKGMTIRMTRDIWQGGAGWITNMVGVILNAPPHPDRGPLPGSPVVEAVFDSGNIWLHEGQFEIVTEPPLRPSVAQLVTTRDAAWVDYQGIDVAEDEAGKQRAWGAYTRAAYAVARRTGFDFDFGAMKDVTL